MKNEAVKNETPGNSSNREYRSSAFTAYFGEAKRAAELYRALDHDEAIGPEDIRFTTLRGVLFLARKNDLAFTAGSKVLVISEHQSTVNQNMPLRGAIYFGRTMEFLVPPKAIYKNKQIPLPTPEFYTFYNGTQVQPREQILRLSDSYIEKTDDPMLELKVKVININLSANHPLLRKSRSMYEYSWFIERIQKHLAEGLPRAAAITAAMKDCRNTGYMTDFIAEHGSEVLNMLFTEFNMEDALEVRGEERYEDGLEDGRKQGLQAGLEDGRRLGHSEGEARIQKLMGYLLEAKRYPDLEKASKDTAYLNLLCQEYGI